MLRETFNEIFLCKSKLFLETKLDFRQKTNSISKHLDNKTKSNVMKDRLKLFTNDHKVLELLCFAWLSVKINIYDVLKCFWVMFFLQCEHFIKQKSNNLKKNCNRGISWWTELKWTKPLLLETYVELIDEWNKNICDQNKTFRKKQKQDVKSQSQVHKKKIKTNGRNIDTIRKKRTIPICVYVCKQFLLGLN